MTEETENMVSDELPPFSFSKKPIKNILPTSAISSKIEKSFADIPQPLQQPTFNNINYDEQIRAPRMSLASHYTYKPELPRPFTDRKRSTLSQMVSSVSKGTILGAEMNTTPLEPLELYHPATADLSQPTRRYLEPLKSSWRAPTGTLLSSGTDTLSEVYEHHDEELASNSNTLENTTTLMQLRLLRAMDNLNGNITSAERTASTEDDNVEFRTRNLQDGPMIQQVYHQKKPMCLPAVLRPMTNEVNIHEEDFHHDLSPEGDFPPTKISEYPFEVPAVMGPDEVMQEPTHEHWKPDTFSDHCMNCFEVFGSFFYPQRKRRHHCRFCGLLYCHNCLYKMRETHLFDITPPRKNSKTPSTRANSGSSNSGSIISGISLASLASDTTPSGVMMDAKARLVIPMFKNLAERGLSAAFLSEKFKICKVCKMCGNNQLRLLYLLNQRSRTRDDIDAPYVFVDNPHMSSTMMAPMRPEFRNNFSRLENNLRTVSERKSSFTNMPSDWTWSTF